MRSMFRAGAACSAVLLVHLLAACAASDDVQAQPDADGGAPAPLADGGAPPSDLDADADASPPRACSEDGFCHTALPKGHSLRAVWGDGKGVVWAVSGQGAILRWDGTEWKIHASGLGPLSAVWGSGPTDVWVGGQSVLFHGTGTSSAALTFAATARPMGEIASIWGTGANDVWAVVVRNDAFPRSLVLHRAPGPGGSPAWSEVTVDPEMRFSHVWGTAASGIWLGGILGDLYSEAPGRIYRRPPGASAFTAVLAPPDPEDPETETEYDPGELVSVSVLSDTSIVLLGRTPYGDEMVVRGKSADSGQTFTFELADFNGEFNGLWSHAVAATTEDDLWVTGEYGRMRHWNGSTWTASALTVTKFPVVSNFYAFWVNGPSDLWVVGEGMALHLDPAKKK
ncbi:MAG: hypothetical protein KF764_28110 [Labilithrix sp.]|nr:hypothetical protein [Labilithrix sp.]